MACCDAFKEYFASKINCIHLELDSELVMQNWTEQRCPSGLILLEVFHFVQSEDMNRILGKVRQNCPLGLIKDAQSWPFCVDLSHRRLSARAVAACP